jgi:hypothetical protein
MNNFPIETCSLRRWHVGGTPDCAAPDEKVPRLLTDTENVQIIHLRKSEHSWITVNSIPKRPSSTCCSLYEKWERIEVFARARGRSRTILWDLEDAIIEKTRYDRRSSVRKVAYGMHMSPIFLVRSDLRLEAEKPVGRI